jgi:hypothetical protein
MKKIILISLLGPLWLIVERGFEVIKYFNVMGLNGVYECQITMHKPCSFFEYVFTSDMSVATQIAIILSFTTLFVLVSYIFYLVKLYKNNNHKLFWILIGITVSLIILGYFAINYIQFVS